MNKKIDIANIRSELGITQAELAELLDVDRKYVSMLETGAKPISAKMSRKLDTLKESGVEAPRYSAAAPPGMVAEENKGYDGTLSEQELHHSTLLRRIDALEIDVALLKKLILK